MKHTLLLVLLLAGAAMGASAQVSVRVNGGEPYPLNTAGGIYFVNDTMEVHPADGEALLIPLDSVSVVTFQVQSTQGISSAQPTPLSIAPVPARDYITVQGIGSSPRQVIIYNAAGQQLLSRTAADGDRIDLRSLPQGAYLLRCGSQVSKIVKQ